MRERGFNQSELIAKNIAQHFSIPINTNVLLRTHQETPHAYLKTHEERKRNIKNTLPNKNNKIP